MHTFGSLSHTNHDHQDNEVNCYQSLHYEKTKQRTTELSDVSLQTKKRRSQLLKRHSL